MFGLAAKVLLLVLFPMVVHGQDEPEKLRVLILDGQNNHDWQKTTAATKATLVACGRFEVDVAASPADRDAKEEWAAWAPEFSDYDVVFSNYNDGGECLWSERTKQAFVDFVRGGGGLVVVHAADNSSGDWPPTEDPPASAPPGPRIARYKPARILRQARPPHIGPPFGTLGRQLETLP